MDLETENRIASILMKEAAELRRQAQKEGALAYLREPTVRCKPNSRFLTATVRGVQQANRVTEVNEMWRLREKQIELDNRIRGSRHGNRNTRDVTDKTLESCRKRSRSHHQNEGSSSSSTSNTQLKRGSQTSEDDGLRDDEVEEFLNSRAKRGRGTVGSRMDETGPYLPPHPEYSEGHSSKSTPDDRSKRSSLILCPERPSFLKCDSSDEKLAKVRKKNKKKCKRSTYLKTVETRRKGTKKQGRWH